MVASVRKETMTRIAEDTEDLAFLVQNAGLIGRVHERDLALVEKIPVYRDRFISRVVEKHPRPDAPPKVVIVCLSDAQRRTAQLAERVLGEEHCVRIEDVKSPVYVPDSGILLLAHSCADARGTEEYDRYPSLVAWASYFTRHFRAYIVYMEHPQDAEQVRAVCAVPFKSMPVAVGCANWFLRHASDFQREFISQRATSIHTKPYLIQFAVQHPSFFPSTRRLCIHLRGAHPIVIPDLMMIHLASEMVLGQHQRVRVVCGADAAEPQSGDVRISSVPTSATADILLLSGEENARAMTLSNGLDTTAYVRQDHPPQLQWPAFQPALIQQFVEHIQSAAPMRSKRAIFLCGDFSSQMLRNLAVVCGADVALVRRSYKSSAAVVAHEWLQDMARSDICIFISHDADQTRATLHPELVLAGMLERPCITNTCPRGPDDFIWLVKNEEDAVHTATDLILSFANPSSELFHHSQRRAASFAAFCASTLSSRRLAERMMRMIS